jgi:site-specific DNA-cytosine methylase
MKVLSLFDGMSCGQIALDQLGIKVDKYYASEIDKYAIQVTQKNYPNTIQVGDICELDPQDFQDVDLIMGGSPCQGFSFAGKQLAFDDPRSKLFFEFVRMVEGIKPKYFLLENVRMKKEYLQIITDMLGVEPIFINSALVSAQSRQRYYWTNIPGIQQPEDRGIVLKDILQDDVNDEFRYGQKSIKYMERGNEKWQQAGKRRADRGVPYNYFKETKQMLELRKDYKSNAITTVGKDSVAVNEDLTWRKLTPLECERLQTVPDNYTEGVSNTQRYKMLGNGWTVEVIKHILGNMT